MRTQILHLDELVLDQGTQIRLTLDKKTVSEYKEAILAGIQLPPIDAKSDGEKNYVFDGFHRIEAHRQAGKTSIECNIHEGTLRDAIFAAAGANARHGLKRSSRDKRNAIATLLKDDEWRQWNDSEIYRHTGTSIPLVGKVRRELEDKGIIPPQTQRKFKKNGVESVMDIDKIGRKGTLNIYSSESDHPPEQSTLFPKNEIYQQGWNAAFLDKPSTDNPYTGKPEAEQLCMQWLKGWHEYHQKNPVDPAQKEEEANKVALTLAHSAGFEAFKNDEELMENPHDQSEDEESLYQYWRKGWLDAQRSLGKKPDIPTEKDLDAVRQKGFTAFQMGKRLKDNPHHYKDPRFESWAEGFRAAENWTASAPGAGGDASAPTQDTENDTEVLRLGLRAYSAGYTAFENGKDLMENPHDKSEDEKSLYQQWNKGWQTAEKFFANQKVPSQKDQETTTAPEQPDLKKASFKGLAARSMGKTFEDNPYSEDDALFQAWAEGFREQDAKLSNAEEEEDTGKERYSAKYRSPLDRSKTWTGLGIKPGWFRDLLEQGYTLDQLRIDAETDTTPAELAIAQGETATADATGGNPEIPADLADLSREHLIAKVVELREEVERLNKVNLELEDGFERIESDLEAAKEQVQDLEEAVSGYRELWHEACSALFRFEVTEEALSTHQTEIDLLHTENSDLRISLEGYRELWHEACDFIVTSTDSDVLKFANVIYGIRLLDSGSVNVYKEIADLQESTSGYRELWHEACDQIAEDCLIIDENNQYLRDNERAVVESFEIQAAVHHVLSSWQDRLLPYLNRPRAKQSSYREACTMFRDLAEKTGFQYEASASNDSDFPPDTSKKLNKSETANFDKPDYSAMGAVQ